VKFDDTAASTTVSLTGTVTPGSVTVSNETQNFTWTGSGKLSGTAGITKQGAGKLTIANAGVNDNVGQTTISGGTLEVGNGGTSGNLNSAAIANSGTLVFNRSDTLTVANVISGAGKVEKQGAGLMILSAAQPNLTGPIAVSAGTLRPGNATALGTVAAGTTVADGATLDVNGLNLGGEVVTVSGSGADGLGAIINSGAGQNNAFQYVTLAGNTVFGGIGRWDIRAGTSPYLSTSGNPYNLTKVGLNQFSLVGVTVDSALADIDVKEGLFDYESTTSGLGDPNRTLTVRSNATLQFWGATVPLNKRISLEGGSSLNAGSGTANSIVGPVKLLNGMAKLNSVSGAIIYYQGPLSGSGGLVKGDAGSVHLVAANSFTGNVVHNYGNLVLSNNLSVGTSKTLTVNYNTAVSAGTGTRLYLRGGITTPEDVVSLFNTTSLGGDYRCSITSDVLTNTWTGPTLLQGSGIVGFYCDYATNLLNITGPILSTNGFTGTAMFRGSHGIASVSGRVSGKVQMPSGTLTLTDNTAWEFSNPDNVWAKTSISYGKVVLGADNAACATAPLSLGQSGTSTGTLDLNGFNQTVPSITTVNGNNHWITNGSATADSVFTFNGGTNVSILDGRITDNLRKLSLTVSSGSLTLLGNNTYKGDTLVSGGTLALGAAGTLASTPLITVATGATLDTSAKGAAGLSLAAGQMLVGAGTIKGALTVGAGATLSAGASIGELAITSALTLAGTNVVQVNSGVAPSSDLVNAGSVTYGGTLVVQNLGPALTAGNSFKLFSATAYSGAFAEILPAKPAAGLVWDTSKLAVDGTLAVLQGIPLTPTNITATVTANTLKLSWPAEYIGWRLEAQTNSLTTGLSGQWVVVPESTATNEMSFPIDPSQPTVFYRLGYQVAP
ncbi:MAG TPA: autotransporter-associated beta strand repeat-containing protein, partial [Bacillota bacterium]|nr:autotransporter-associated beta strand repeat-containing protein [Bacillota bacterium]